jgi:hypothetical protein
MSLSSSGLSSIVEILVSYLIGYDLKIFCTIVLSVSSPTSLIDLTT